MKTFFILPLMVGLALGTSAQAFPGMSGGERAATVHPWTASATTEAEAEALLRDSCIGLAAGTAHRNCGTATGGPAGGLH